MNYPPIPPKKIITGHLSDFKTDPINFMISSAKDYGDIVLFEILNKKVYFINNPDYIKHVLHSNHKNFVKSPGYKPLRLLGGMGIFTNDGEEWIRRRKFYGPALSEKALLDYFNDVLEISNSMLSSWKGTEVNVSKEMSKVTMNIICQSLFSQQIDFGSELWDDMNYALSWIGERVLKNPFVIPYKVPSKSNQRFKRAVENLNNVIFPIIENKKSELNKKRDLLSRFMEPDSDGLKPLNEQELRDELMTIFIAGHESSANVLSWALYEIASRTDVQERLYKEIESVDIDNMNYMDLMKFPYMTAVLNETMRLYPPLWHIGRMNLEDDEIGGYKIPKGSHIRMSPLVMGRSEKYWDKVNDFNPDRFFEQEKPNPHIFFPFGAGPRLCPGRNFAMMEMVVILVKVLDRYKLNYSNSNPEMSPKMTLRTKLDVLVELVKR